MSKTHRRTPRATDGGSAVALLARQRPGGKHDRRKKARGPAKRRAIAEAS